MTGELPCPTRPQADAFSLPLSSARIGFNFTTAPIKLFSECVGVRFYIFRSPIFDSRGVGLRAPSAAAHVSSARECAATCAAQRRFLWESKWDRLRGRARPAALCMLQYCRETPKWYVR